MLGFLETLVSQGSVVFTSCIFTFYWSLVDVLHNFRYLASLQWARLQEVQYVFKAAGPYIKMTKF